MILILWLGCAYETTFLGDLTEKDKQCTAQIYRKDGNVVADSSLLIGQDRKCNCTGEQKRLCDVTVKMTALCNCVTKNKSNGKTQCGSNCINQ